MRCGRGLGSLEVIDPVAANSLVRQRLTRLFSSRLYLEAATMSARISARLDDITREKLESLQAETHKSVTELITEALDLYFQQRRTQTKASNQALLDVAGSFGGSADLSKNYKDEFSEAVNDKLRNHR